MQSSSITLDSEYNIGSFIASINDSLVLNDCQYIKGGEYKLQCVSILGNQINGGAVFEQTCNFENEICSAGNEDISTFQTNDIKILTTFNPKPLTVSESKTLFSIDVFPNPFNDSFQIKFSEPYIFIINCYDKCNR